MMSERKPLEISRRELFTEMFRGRDGRLGFSPRTLPDPEAWVENMDRVLEAMGDLSGIEDPRPGLAPIDTGADNAPRRLRHEERRS